MADEFYREEIVFDVNDSEAISRVSRAENRINKALKRSRRQSQRLGRTKAAPIISVKDRMSQKVKKADKLVNKLNREKATPIIKAKDNVTGVIKKTDRMLDAMSRSDNSVTMKMKGDLLDDVKRTQDHLETIKTAKFSPRARLKGNLIKELKRAEKNIRTVGMMRARPKVTLRDRVSRALNHVRRGLRKVSTKSWEITIAVKNKTFAVFRRVKRAIGGIKRMITSMPALLGAGAGVAGPGLLIQNAISSAADYEQSMAHVQAVSGATGEAFEDLKGKAREMGRSTEFSATQSADALGYLSMAGFEANESVKALPDALDLATAGQLDLARSADITSNVLSGFEYDIKEYKRVVDVMAKTQATANTNVEQLGNALSYAAPGASDASQSIESTAAAIAKVSDAGIQASRAGTAMRKIFADLVNPTSTAREEMENMGVAVTDSAGELKDLPDIIRAVEKSSMKGADAYKVFGNEAGPAFSKLVSIGADSLEDYTQKLKDSEGAASDAADTMRDTVQGAFDSLSASWESLMITIGGEDGLGPAARSVVENLTDKFGDLESFIKDNQQAIENFATTVSNKLNNGIESGFEYIREHYLENEEFTNLDIAGKVSFVIGDFTEKLTEWVNSDAAESVAKSGAELGTGMISAMAKAMSKQIMEDPVTSMLLGGVILGTTTKLPIAIPLTITVSGAGAKVVKWLMNKSDDYWKNNGPSAKAKEYNDTVSGKNKPKHGYGGREATIDEAPDKGFFGKTWGAIKGGFNSVRESVRGYATGGFINQEHLAMVGEENKPEMVIPLSSEKRDQGMALWRQAGEMMGVTPFAQGGISGNAESVSGGATVQATVDASGIEREANEYGESFSTNLAKGINNKVVSLEEWKQRNIKNPMRNVVQKAVGYGSDTVQSFAKGQDATQTGTLTYLKGHVHKPFMRTENEGSSWGSGTIAEFASGMKSKGEHVTKTAKELADRVEKAFKDELGIESPSKVMMKLGQFASMGVVKGLDSVDIKSFAEGQAGSLAAAFADMSSVGGNVKAWLKAAMAVTGAPDNWLGPLSTIAQKESGGRTGPGTINTWDINAKRGTPSMGLMQTIGPTFQAHKGEGMNDIMNPVHNAVAAINYIKSRYGTPFNTPGIQSMMHGGPYKGYFRGTPGPLNQDRRVMVGERGPEMVDLPRGAQVTPNHQMGAPEYRAPEYKAPEPEYGSGQSSSNGGQQVVQLNTDGMIGQVIIQDESDIDEIADGVADKFAKQLKAIFNNRS